MSAPVVIGYMPLCVTPRSKVCDEQGINWPMWQLYADVMAIVEQYVDQRYRKFLAMPVYEDDPMQNEERFYWFTPSSNNPYRRLSQMGDEHDHYKAVLKETLDHYQKVMEQLEREGRTEDAEYLRLSLKYAGDCEELVYCGDEHVVATLWGMRPRTGRDVDPAVVSKDIGVMEKLCSVKFDFAGHGDQIEMKIMQGSKISAAQVPSPVEVDGYDFVGWDSEPEGAEVKDDMMFTAQYRELSSHEDEKPLVYPPVDSPVDSPVDPPMPITHRVRFLMPDGIVIRELAVNHNEMIPPGQIPQLPFYDATPCPAWDSDPLRDVINRDIDYKALLPQAPPPPPPIEKHKVRFLMPDGVVISEIMVPHGGQILPDQVPSLPVINGIVCSSWNADPLDDFIFTDKDYTALAPVVIKTHTVRFLTPDGDEVSRVQVEHGNRLTNSQIPTLPVIKGKLCRKWSPNPHKEVINKDTDFIARKRCGWHWPLIKSGFWRWLLRVLLFLLLLFLVLYIIQLFNPVFGSSNNQTPTPPGYEEILPPYMRDLPPIDTTRIIDRPNQPPIIDNRLNILLEDEDKSVFEFAKDFKQVYPGDKYPIVYYDTLVKRIQIECPPEEREALTNDIPAKLAPKYTLYVFDEALFSIYYTPSDPDYQDNDKRWHLDAIGMEMAWNYTQGESSVIIAVIDNGFNLKHPEFRKPVVMPYNVWTHSRHVTAFPPKDHGTHVAGIALATIDNKHGICGVAPQCAFMPVRVSDENGKMTTTSVLDGILYALHQGADVINVSIGSGFEKGIPFNKQLELLNCYKAEERLWNEVMHIADRNNSIIVTSAGNSNILAGVDPMNRPCNFVVVSAVDYEDGGLWKADFSNYGSFSDVSAPGVNIYSTYGPDTYKRTNGTSMAAPMASGAVALMRCMDSTLTAEQAICVLKNTGKFVNGNIGEMIQVDVALEYIENGKHKDCTYTPTASTGDVQILLKWNDYNDLDLRCTDPSGYDLYYHNRLSPTSGVFEIDMNVEYPGTSDHPSSANPVENIYWPSGQAPRGNYVVYVKMYNQHLSTVVSSEYTVELTRLGEKKFFTGSVNKESDWVKVCEFEIP